jgi:DNA topoisomerase-3
MEEGGQARLDFMDGICGLATQLIDTIRAKASQTPVAPPAEAKLLSATCPKCSNPVKEGKFAYQCVGAGCPVKIPRDILKRPIKEAEANLILQGQSPEMNGFVSPKSGNKFSMRLVFNEAFDRLDFKFAERLTTPTEGAQPLGACPLCRAGVFKIGDHYKCEAGSGERRDCNFIIFGEMSKYRLAEAEVVDLLTKRRTAPISKLKSKAGKPFTAALVLGDDGKVNFDFPDKR